MRSDHVTSPFRPGYGKRPLVFGGHERAIEELTEVFDTLDFGENHSVLVSGLRGAGKTSMLSLLRSEAEERGWLVISDNASSGLMERVMETTVPKLVDGLDTESKRRLTSLGVWQFTASWEYRDRRREVRPLLRDDLVALSRAVDGRGILITIDEVSSGKVRLRELSRFAREIAHALEDDVDLMVVFAGIKVDLDELLKQEHTTFLRRSKDLDFRRLSPQETKHVLAETARIGGRPVDPDALDRLTAISQGYPYLVQLVGDYAWRADPTGRTITLRDAEAALDRAVTAVQSRVIDRVYLDLSEKDRAFVRAMAQDDGATRISDLVARLGVSDSYVQVYKKRLIDTGYVVQAGHGQVDFSLPYLREYLRDLDDTSTAAHRDDPWSQYPAPPL